MIKVGKVSAFSHEFIRERLFFESDICCAGRSDDEKRKQEEFHGVGRDKGTVIQAVILHDSNTVFGKRCLRIYLFHQSLL
jgi:hypothetical protein